MQAYTDFNKDNKKGFIGEQIFENEFLKRFNIKYKNVSNDRGYRKKDIDYVTDKSTYEIKNSYKDDERLTIGECHNIDKRYYGAKKGWWYQTQADYIVFISGATHKMIFLQMNEKVMEIYENIKDKYPLIKNKMSYNPNNPNDDTNKWQSAFRVISLSEFSGHYKVIDKKIEWNSSDWDEKGNWNRSNPPYTPEDLEKYRNSPEFN